MADVVYEIKISGLVGGDGTGGSSTTMQDAMLKRENKSKSTQSATFSTNSLLQGLQGKRSASMVLAGAGLYVAKNALNNYVQTIGLRTGNYHLQEQIEFGLSIASNIGNSVLGGALAGGVAGAVAGAVVGLGKTAIDSIISEYTAGIKRNYSIQDAREHQRVVSNASYGNNRLGGALY